MPSIAGVNIPLGQQKKTESGTGTGGTTGTEPTQTEPSGGTTQTSSTPTEPTSGSTPTSSPSSPQPSYAYSGTINEVSPMPPSLRELLAQDAAVAVTPLGELAEALRTSNAQAPDRLDAFSPGQSNLTAAQIMAQASAAMVAQATHSEQSVMAVLKQMQG